VSAHAAGVGAFFDIDHTVLEINSGTMWIRHLWRTDRMSTVELVRSSWWLVQYRFGMLDFDAMSARVVAQYRGREEAPLREEVERWFEAELAWAICTRAREQIEDHRAQGHVIALLTSATRYLSIPVARAVGVDHILCTEVEVDQGLFTGKLAPPACYGAGKVTHAERFAGAHAIDLDASYFYTDSYSDLPMLERVGFPRVINPDPRLRRAAARLGWPVEQWTAPRPQAGASP
jgi:HAD superfamily hydrolase (TIGR01490 family)